jgi:hypothetical protein
MDNFFNCFMTSPPTAFGVHRIRFAYPQDTLRYASRPSGSDPGGDTASRASHPKRRGEKIEKNRMARQKSPSHSIFFKEL